MHTLSGIQNHVASIRTTNTHILNSEVSLTIKQDLYYHHHHRMALQPNLGPGFPFLGFRNNNLFTGLDCWSRAQPSTGGPGIRIYDPRRQGGRSVATMARQLWG
jgi:hypothetical protein